VKAKINKKVNFVSTQGIIEITVLVQHNQEIEKLTCKYTFWLGIIPYYNIYKNNSGIRAISKKGMSKR
jgi:CTP:phosphocholine cytidylyltransferase-like protein